jgi:hypothetical protein
MQEQYILYALKIFSNLRFQIDEKYFFLKKPTVFNTMSSFFQGKI